MPDAGLTLFLELPPDVHTVDRDAGQDVGLLLIAYWFPQRGVVPLPVHAAMPVSGILFRTAITLEGT